MKKGLILFTFAMIMTNILNAQPPHWRGAGGNPPAGADGIGVANNQFGTAAGNPVSIKFITNGFQRMTILDGGVGGGFVGIGPGFLLPVHLLDLRLGDINCGNGTPASPQGYMIGDNYVLRHKGDPNNIFVGVNAGFFNTTGTRNTFVGNSAGFANDGAVDNTFLGYRSGLTNTGVGGFGFQNSFMGYNSGEVNFTA